jgi:2-keto-4-pentenoate hydratase/2-oxohepta-3-ene-1,7-dioic acid hydratase in catechol pathway
VTIWARFEKDGIASYGVVEDAQITRVDGSPFGAYRLTSAKVRLDSVRLLFPVLPGVFYAAGVNYRDHVAKYNAAYGTSHKVWTKVDIGYRANNALIGQDAAIVRPRDAGKQFDYEGELVVVIGKKARNVPKEKALEYVFGYTIGNDVSVREWQSCDRTLWRAKNADTLKPMGPWIVTDLDLGSMWTTVRLNGRQVEHFKTDTMVFDVPTMISAISEHCTLHPGDVLWCGTDGLPLNMNEGDLVEIEISGIGVLRNAVVAAA